MSQQNTIERKEEERGRRRDQGGKVSPFSRSFRLLFSLTCCGHNRIRVGGQKEKEEEASFTSPPPLFLGSVLRPREDSGIGHQPSLLSLPPFLSS